MTHPSVAVSNPLSGELVTQTVPSSIFSLGNVAPTNAVVLLSNIESVIETLQLFIPRLPLPDQPIHNFWGLAQWFSNWIQKTPGDPVDALQLPIHITFSLSCIGDVICYEAKLYPGDHIDTSIIYTFANQAEGPIQMKIDIHKTEGAAFYEKVRILTTTFGIERIA